MFDLSQIRDPSRLCRLHFRSGAWKGYGRLLSFLQKMPGQSGAGGMGLSAGLSS